VEARAVPSSRRPSSGDSGDSGSAPSRRPGLDAEYAEYADHPAEPEPEPEPELGLGLDWSPAWTESGPSGSPRPSSARPSSARPSSPGPDDRSGLSPEAAARQVCLQLLTLAPRTRAQLADALRRRHIPDEAAEAVLDRFTEIGLIDDPAFARAWVESRHHGRGLSRRALSNELRRRGVPDEDVHEAIELVDDDQEAAMARQVIAGKVRATRGQPSAARIRKLMGVLARKGYGAALAYRVVREALEAEGAYAAEIAAEIGEPDPDIGSEDCP
jgi:regulatory protein